jgi:hypothetical protein
MECGALQLSISDILPYLDCRYKGITRLSAQRWTPPTSRQQLGTIIHKHCDDLLTTGRINHDYSWIDPVLLPEAEPLLSEADLALCPPPFKVLASEIPLTTEIGNDVHLVGRLDAVALFNDRIYSVQWKTVGKGVSIGPFLEKVRMSPHEISYRYMLRQDNRFKDCAGTLLGVFRTYLTKQQKEDNVPRFELFELEATEEEDAEAFELDIATTGRELARSVHDGPRVRNWTACQSIFGTCPLYQHCHFGSSIEDCLVSPLENRYQDVKHD